MIIKQILNIKYYFITTFINLMMESKTSVYRDNFPGYGGYIPYKMEVIGKTVGASNEHIKKLLTTEPPKEEIIKPLAYEDYAQYNRDYFNDNFSREYKLEEDQIFSNKSKEAVTWISGNKYKIYPQHVPGFQAHVPGIISSNIHGMGYSKSTAVAIKGDYNKTGDLKSEERYKSTASSYFGRPKTRSDEEEKYMTTQKSYRPSQDSEKATSLKQNLRKIYQSKIAQVPTPGYSGHTSIFLKPISYLNLDRIKDNFIKESQIPPKLGDDLPESFQKSLDLDEGDNGELPYIVGYKGFRLGVKARNFHGQNFRETSLAARRTAKIQI